MAVAPDQQYASRPLVAAAQKITAALARTIGAQAAAHAVHSAALVQHASAAGIITTSGDPATDLKQVAALHPQLAGLASPDVNQAYGADYDATAVEQLWRDHSIADHPDRVIGHKLGDLYQQLSEEARKGRALCQTPKFITDLLLDISFNRAYREGGPHIEMIDPACGTGHILTETLIRASTLQWLGISGRSRVRALPAMRPFERVSAALNVVHGVDLDPYAVAVTCYRLLVVAHGMLVATRHRPSAAELAALPLHVAAADALLSDDEPLLERGRYDVVVANPPYITCKDRAANEAIRARYRQVCSGKFSLALPFHALMTELLRPGGWCAQLTGNSFMKREFGKSYCEKFLPTVDLTWVIDTSGVYIPGHGTPTVILANRNQPPTSATVPVVMGQRGEPGVLEDPARGVVWRAIEAAVNEHESLARLAAALATPAAEPEPHAAAAYVQPPIFDLLEMT